MSYFLESPVDIETGKNALAEHMKSSIIAPLSYGTIQGMNHRETHCSHLNQGVCDYVEHKVFLKQLLVFAKSFLPKGS